jgi:hypothetical protein
MKLRRPIIALVAAVAAFGVTAPSALAASGHFIENGAGAPECTDLGLQVECTGKVAGLGGTTFEITLSADGIASVECENPGGPPGNRAPGQDTAISVAGSSGELPTPRNGQFVFTVETATPEPLPPTPTCPNDQWIPHIVDVSFTVATLTLFEDDVLVDTVTVTVG